MRKLALLSQDNEIMNSNLEKTEEIKYKNPRPLRASVQKPTQTETLSTIMQL